MSVKLNGQHKLSWTFLGVSLTMDAQLLIDVNQYFWVGFRTEQSEHSSNKFYLCICPSAKRNYHANAAIIKYRRNSKVFFSFQWNEYRTLDIAIAIFQKDHALEKTTRRILSNFAWLGIVVIGLESFHIINVYSTLFKMIWFYLCQRQKKKKTEKLSVFIIIPCG